MLSNAMSYLTSPDLPIQRMEPLDWEIRVKGKIERKRKLTLQNPFSEFLYLANFHKIGR